MASDYAAQMAKNLGGGQAGEARAGGVSTGSERGEAGSGPGFVFSQSCCVNPLAFHNKSQIINKYMPVMSRLFNRRNWKTQCRVVISLLPRLGSIFFIVLTPPGSASARISADRPALTLPPSRAAAQRPCPGVSRAPEDQRWSLGKAHSQPDSSCLPGWQLQTEECEGAIPGHAGGGPGCTSGAREL